MSQSCENKADRARGPGSLYQKCARTPVVATVPALAQDGGWGDMPLCEGCAEEHRDNRDLVRLPKPCLDCDGTGRDDLFDSHVECVACGGTGKAAA